MDAQSKFRALADFLDGHAAGLNGEPRKANESRIWQQGFDEGRNEFQKSKCAQRGGCFGGNCCLA